MYTKSKKKTRIDMKLKWIYSLEWIVHRKVPIYRIPKKCHSYSFELGKMKRSIEQSPDFWVKEPIPNR